MYVRELKLYTKRMQYIERIVLYVFFETNLKPQNVSVAVSYIVVLLYYCIVQCTLNVELKFGLGALFHLLCEMVKRFSLKCECVSENDFKMFTL